MFLSGLVFSSGCVRVLQDEVAVKRKLGRIDDEVLYPGANRYNPFTTKVFRVPTRTVNLEISVGLPSKEGLTISSEISILYRVDPQAAPEVLRSIGPEYEEALILPVFRSASADVCARYFAKDMHSAQRAKIEQSISERMMEVVGERGFIIESVLMKSIVLPAGLARAIEVKLEAEQSSQRMQFVLAQERQEADRTIIAAEAQRKIAEIQANGRAEAQKIEAAGRAEAQKIEALGTKEANDTVRSGLDDKILQFLSIEAYESLAASPNTKVIVPNDPRVLLDVK
ncbi:MAG: prohibitin family protein [Nannocystaceae bacterium]